MPIDSNVCWIERELCVFETNEEKSITTRIFIYTYMCEVGHTVRRFHRSVWRMRKRLLLCFCFYFVANGS